jgi:hypothetical protein
MDTEENEAGKVVTTEDVLIEEEDDEANEEF